MWLNDWLINWLNLEQLRLRWRVGASLQGAHAVSKFFPCGSFSVSFGP